MKQSTVVITPFLPLFVSRDHTVEDHSLHANPLHTENHLPNKILSMLLGFMIKIGFNHFIMIFNAFVALNKQLADI